jgi:Ser/Thr protein kinase RdoA (MazF antagonist)
MEIKHITEKYSILKNHTKPQPFGQGHINDTYLVEASGVEYILQRVNGKVFNTPVLTSNLNFLFDALSEYENKNGKKLTPAILKNDEGNFHTIDNEGYAWRLMEFFPGCNSYAISPSTEISYKAAKAVGEFQLFLNQLHVNDFDDTIKDFHNTPGRLETFLNTVKKASPSLVEQAATEIQFVKQNHFIACRIEELSDDGTLPRRITHNDTKLDNILFTQNSGVIIIDLDTVMPGYIMYDYGDMVRTFTSPAKEDEQDINKTVLRIEHFKALTKGYLEPLKNHLTATEKESLLLGAKAIIYEQIIRFLNDFLLGNIYYKTAYPTHNLIRTRTQIRLLEDILSREKELQQIINNEL